MIPKVKKFKLIAMYFYISDRYDKELKYSCQRFSNNSEPDFKDQEIMTFYLYGMHIEQRFKIKQICEYASHHLPSWFPLLLPSYEAFNMTLNRLGEAFRFFEKTQFDTNTLKVKYGLTFFSSSPLISFTI